MVLRSRLLAAALVWDERKSKGNKNKRKRKMGNLENLSKGEGGVVAPPFVFHAALVVATICLRWFLGHERVGQKDRGQFPIVLMKNGRWTYLDTNRLFGHF